MVVSFWSVMVSEFSIRAISKGWFLKIVHETGSISCHVSIHVDFYIHLAFTYFVSPSCVV